MGETSRGTDTSQAGRGHGGSITAPLAGRRAVPAGTGRVGGVRLDATSPLALASHLVGLARDADRTGLSGLRPTCRANRVAMGPARTGACC